MFKRHVLKKKKTKSLLTGCRSPLFLWLQWTQRSNCDCSVARRQQRLASVLLLVYPSYLPYIHALLGPIPPSLRVCQRGEGGTKGWERWKGRRLHGDVMHERGIVSSDKSPNGSVREDGEEEGGRLAPAERNQEGGTEDSLGRLWDKRDRTEDCSFRTEAEGSVGEQHSGHLHHCSPRWTSAWAVCLEPVSAACGSISACFTVFLLFCACVCVSLGDCVVCVFFSCKYDETDDCTQEGTALRTTIVVVMILFCWQRSSFTRSLFLSF